MKTRLWKTYELIKENTLKGKITTQREIVDNYPYDADLEQRFNGISVANEDGYVWNTNPKGHDHCSQVWADINEINSDATIQKIIISVAPYQYKLAETKEEVANYCYKIYYKPAMAKLVRQHRLLAKVKLDGQGKLLFNDKSQAREYYETFVRNMVDDLVENAYETNDTSNQ